MVDWTVADEDSQRLPVLADKGGRTLSKTKTAAGSFPTARLAMTAV